MPTCPVPGKVDRKSECGSFGSNQAGTASALPQLEGFLFSESIIDAATLQAYRDTHYRVHASEPFTLRIGETCPALAAAHQSCRTDSSAFITAFNPFSQVLSDELNAQRHAQLRRELDLRSLKYIEGVGQHPSNQWPGEVSYLVFGLGLEAAKNLGSKFEQNAIVWSGADATPQLILLR